MDFKGKTVVITGGSEGVGGATAHAFADAGASLVLAARTRKNLEEVAEELRDKTRVEIFAMDVADTVACSDLLKKAQFEFGSVHVLVNNAGIVQRATHDKITPEHIDHTFSINLLGMMHMCLECIPALKRSKGSIINISSSLTDRCAPEYGVYAATKGAMNAWSKTLSMELARWRVRVNVVSPSMVRSEIYFADGMSRKEYNNHLKELGDTYFPLGRSGEPRDISGMVAFLASDESTWMTGQIVTIDGGEAVGRKRW